MIKHLRTLKKELRGYDIYVWDVGKRATWTFSQLAYRGIPVSGFVTDKDSFAGKAAAGRTIMGRPVISAEEFSALPGALLAFDDETPERVMRSVPVPGGMRLKDMFDYSPDLFNGTHFIYGAGAHAWLLLKRFAREGIDIGGLYVTEKTPDMPGEVLGLPVIEFDPDRPDRADSVILGTTVFPATEDIPALLECSGFSGDLFVDEFVSRRDLWGADTFIMLSRALDEGRRVFLCCADPMAGSLIEDTLRLYGVRIAGRIAPDDIYSLAAENPQKSTLIIHSYDRKLRFEMAQAARDLGFSPEYGNFSATGRSCYGLPIAAGYIDYEEDSLLGASIDYTPLGGKPGWAVYGEETDGAVRIMVIGGSTTSDIFRVENWASKLQKICAANGISAVIYNGARESDSSTEELIRLTRDIRYLRPDIVISMSGINDAASPSGKFERFKDETPFDHWKRIEGYIKLIAESEGAEFHCFLQPINVYKPEPDFDDILRFIPDTGGRGRSFITGANGDDFYHDLLRLFHDEDGMFTDHAHYSEAGTARIAEEVFRAVFGPAGEEA